MFLNHEELKKENLIDNTDPTFFDNASYDLRVGNILTYDGQEKLEHQILPNSMVVIISKEKLSLPADRIGHAFIKTRLSQKGLMANNIGIIDPQYEGYISTVLTNFGKHPYLIKENEPFLRISISKFKKPSQNIDLGFESLNLKNYTFMVKSKTVTHLDKNFINIDEKANQIERAVDEKHENTARKRYRDETIRFAVYAVLLTAFGLIANVIVKDGNEEKYNELKDEVIKMQETYYLDGTNKRKIDNKLSELNNMDIFLYEKLDSISTKLDSLMKKN